MTPLCCVDVCRRLASYHDGELPVEEQIAVVAHLRECLDCSEEAEGLRAIGECLRDGVAILPPPSAVDLELMQADVMSRVHVEHEESLSMQVAHLFDDMRLSCAALGATAATLVSILVMTGIFYFGPRTERPDSLAGVMETLGAHPINTYGMLLPRADPDGVVEGVFGGSEEDAVFALAAVVTRQGRIANLELVLAEQPTGVERQRVMRLLDDVSRARFEPARYGGSPVAVNVVWLLAHTTVRGTKPLPPKQSSLKLASVALS